MGGGDLNLKKSWHPSTFHNLKKLWEAEQADEKEKQKLEQLRKEKAAERDAEDLRKLQERAGLITQKPERVEWLYSGSCPSIAGPASLAEEYLLGKRRFEAPAIRDELPVAILGDARPAKSGPLSMSTTVNSAHEVEARLREDPLLTIKKKEKELLEKSARTHSRSSRIDLKHHTRAAVSKVDRQGQSGHSSERDSKTGRMKSPHRTSYSRNRP